jgi:hypothetical protein
MNITIDWQIPLQLTRHKKIIIDAKSVSEWIDARPGVYMFTRKFGQNYVPFYIGETLSIQDRLKAHLKSAQIADVLRGLAGYTEIKKGTRHFHFGYLRGNFQKDATKKRLEIVQRYLIRTAIEQDIPILNSSLTKRPTHALVFNGGPAARVHLDKAATIEA